MPRTRAELWTLDPTIWRAVEDDGFPVLRWLRDEPSDGLPLDRGVGFESYLDATFFCLGIDWIRAEAGELGDLTTADIDRERFAIERVIARESFSFSAETLAILGNKVFLMTPNERRRALYAITGSRERLSERRGRWDSSTALDALSAL